MPWWRSRLHVDISSSTVTAAVGHLHQSLATGHSGQWQVYLTCYKQHSEIKVNMQSLLLEQHNTYHAQLQTATVWFSLLCPGFGPGIHKSWHRNNNERPSWGMRIEIFNSWHLPQFQHLQHTWGEFKMHPVYAGVSEQIKPLQLVCQATELKFESNFYTLQIIWQLFPKATSFSSRANRV